MYRVGVIVVTVLVLGGLMALVIWRMVRSLKNSDEPGTLIVKWLVTAALLVMAYFSIRPLLGGISTVFAVLVAAVYGVALAALWARHVAEILAKPFESLYTGGDRAPDPEPLYSIAQARRIQGKYREAMYEIQKQLTQFPHDFAGQMMIAQIQAENLNDLPAAELTIERLSHQPGRTPAQIAGAFSALADWHQKYSVDAEAARQAFEKIIAMLPETPQAQMAAQRIAHLAPTESLVAAHDRPPMPVEPGVEDIGLRQDSSDLRRPETQPARQATDLVRHLALHPFDFEAREKLALIYVEHFNRLDLATDQLEQLIQQPHQSVKQMAHWLNLLADLQVRFGGGFDAARSTLERIMELQPGSAAAEQARQRLSHLRLEFKRNEQSQTLRLGSYEKDLGLKRGGPH